MGRLLKEALKCLCSENHWSYAVFWKIGYRNPALLVWEEYHYEPIRRSILQPISGIESSDMLLKEWEGIWNSSESCLPKLECQTDDEVVLLINKMMINNQIHIVGEGIVGRAAFMGLHQWVLQETCMMEHYPSEVLAELLHQFSAGMETVAVIPVLPHGVVQFGSTSAVVESMGFVNDVKNLFAQLGGVPGALLSDTYTRTGPGPNFTVSTSRESPISATSPTFFQSQAPMLAPCLGAGFNQQNLVIQGSKFGSPPFPSVVTQVQNTPQVQSNRNTTPTISESLTDLVQIPPVMQLNHLPRGLQESREAGAHVTLPSSDTKFRHQASSQHSSLRSNNQISESISSCSGVSNAGVHILSSAGLQKAVPNGLATSKSNKSCITSSGGKISTSVKDSILARLRGNSNSFDAGNDLQTLAPVPSISVASGSIERCSAPQTLKGIHPNLPPLGMLSTSNHQNWSNNSDVLRGKPHQSQPSTDDNRSRTSWTGGEQVLENDLFQSLHILAEYSDEHISRCRPMPDSFRGSWASNSLHNKEKSTSSNINCEEAYVQPPLGDDLFDILGLDLKSEKHSGSWNSSLIHVADSNMRNADMDISTCINQMDDSPGFHVAKEGISESGIFSETASDHLLDAVVSKVHSSAKTIMDEEMSCWTTLTKISKSSVATGSPSCGQGSASEHKKGKFSDIPSPPIKAQVGSSSLKSGCTKDNTGETSQISSMYGSQISLVAEDSQNMKHENSISTAHSKRPHETGKANRKRLKPGENPRPRPKDRQMIQDRVKELREIVPNGAKCSIDSLLERTIRHMLFLQSVTKHADKLKETGESKIISKEGGLLLNDSFDGGATWAYEVGSQSMVCPIIVEDLNSPRQMLVEMLCEERGLFLEIADIIRGLGLTILKGVMEARNDKVWVRFTVEANRDVTRMEIFMALVHLLEQAVKNSAPASKGIASGNLLSHGTSHQASIPATGQSDNLQ